jgi:hypothetical protein
MSYQREQLFGSLGVTVFDGGENAGDVIHGRGLQIGPDPRIVGLRVHGRVAIGVGQ